MECGGRVCLGTLPVGIFERTGSNGEDTEGLVDYSRSVEGVEIGVLIEQRPSGAVKASLRAREALPTGSTSSPRSSAAGGHACAAGLNLKAATPDFRPRLIAAARRGGSAEVGLRRASAEAPPPMLGPP